MKQSIVFMVVTAGIVTVMPVVTGRAQAPPSPDQVVAALKQNLADSQKRIRQYEWVETTTVSLKGEEKSRKQQRVYYGVDGKLTKLPIGAQPPASGGGRGIKGRIVENKKDDMAEYMERAVSLIHQYVPPNPAQIQKAKDGGNVALRPLSQGKVRVELQNFVQPADLLSLDVDAKSAALSGIKVATYLDKKEDAVTLDVSFSALPDGTSYSQRTTLDAKAKNISVVLENSGYRPLAQ